ncbi:FapA family protein [Massilia solisilvae]|uniref:FapA family protein n=1 Tax=Massilia solisilvae TaxID=1811225 RepID=A0ABT2BGF5_9BURK|nr:FapA family protein [Massilia solisilvae]MCS0607520.1 FapA family protein [Massilia solisilvae]
MPAATTNDGSPAGGAASMPEYGVVQREDGVFLDPSLPRAGLMAAIDNIFAANNYFAGLDYAVLLRALYGVGAPLPLNPHGDGWVRFASGIVPFDRARRQLYRAVKLDKGMAEYYFEPVYLDDPGDPGGSGVPARLDLDEFVADLWTKGIRFGIDLDAVRAAIASSQSGRLVVARKLDALPGQDARVIEVSDDIHRNDAPRQLANGKLDLNSFQNRFPQIKEGVRLLKKLPRVPGTAGYELNGNVIEPAVPADLDLQAYCGLGTVVQRTPDGEFLVSQQAGFLTVDRKTSQISVGGKIVSHDGVSVKTTGNLQLSGDYEEFGEIQEKRVIEGDSITVHADVFGTVVSRGGAVVLNRNLVGGTAINKQGSITVRGMVSGATIQASGGDVELQRAENSVISGRAVRIEHAINCEIVGETVEVGQAEGCAIAGRTLAIETAAPRRQSEMVVFVQVPDSARINSVLAATAVRAEQLEQAAARYKAEVDRLAGQPDVRKYMRLAASVRKNEITLTPEQVPAFQRMAKAVGPVLKEIGKASDAQKAAELELQQSRELVAQLERQRDGAGVSRVAVRSVQGDIQVRALKYDPDDGSSWDLPARDIKARLRGNTAGAPLFSGSAGAFEWDSEHARA